MIPGADIGGTLAPGVGEANQFVAAVVEVVETVRAGPVALGIALEECREKAAIGRYEFAQFFQAKADIVRVEVPVQRQRQRILRFLGKLIELETVGYDKFWHFSRRDLRRQLLAKPALNNFLLAIQTEIVARCEIGNEMHTTAQRATAYNEEAVIRF